MARWSEVLVICKKPRSLGAKKAHSLVPCGECKPCRINTARTWTHRIMLESSCHPDNAFVTLTYSRSHCPADGSLLPSHLDEWKDKFREACRRRGITGLRFYAVGEYGDKNFRPHFHLIVFGYPPCQNPYRKKFLRRRKKGCDCSSCLLVQESWAMGFTDVGDVTMQSSRYVAGYVVKKMTKPTDPRLEGRFPEFCRNRAKPGIGVPAVKYIADALYDSHTGELHLDENGDVPSLFACNGKKYPIGRFLRSKLRSQLGISDDKGKQAFIRWQTEMQTLFGNASYVEDDQTILGRRRLPDALNSLSEFLVEQAGPKMSKLERTYAYQQQKKAFYEEE